MGKRKYPLLKVQKREKFRSCIQHFSNDGGKTYVVTTSANSVKWADQVTLGPSPNGWKVAISQGNNATSVLDGYKQVHGCAGLDYSHRGTKPGLMDIVITSGVNINAGSEVTYPAAVVDPLATYLASKRLLGSIISQQSTWRGGNFIAEFAETVEMLAHPLKSIFSHTWTFVGNVGKLKKVYKRDPIRYGRLLGGAWLAYAFGIKPLVDDANDAQAAVDNLREELGSFDSMAISGSGVAEGMLHVSAHTGVPKCPYAVYDEDRISRSRVKYYGALRATPTGWPQIAQNFGVGFTDIVPAVWEAVPWSFLVDYFVNVGEMLDSAKLAFVDLAWLNQGTQVSLETRTSAAYVSAAAAPNGYDVVPGGGAGVSKRVWKHRTATTIPYPGWNFRIPGLSSRKWCNVTALVAQIAGSRPLR